MVDNVEELHPYLQTHLLAQTEGAAEAHLRLAGADNDNRCDRPQTVQVFQKQWLFKCPGFRTACQASVRRVIGCLPSGDPPGFQAAILPIGR
jgi:hypothetical protein